MSEEMSRVFERISQELTLEVYDLKIKLKLAEEKIQEQNDEIVKLTDTCVMLKAENVFLNNQCKELTTPKISRPRAAICSAPYKADRDEDSSGISSNSSDRWLTVEKTRKPRFSDLFGDLAPESASCLRIHVSQLNPATREDTIRDYFSRFGDIEDIFIRGPGFAFVTFRRFFGDSPLAFLNHEIDGKAVELQPAKRNYRPGGKPSHKLLVTPSKGSITDSQLRGHFSKFGTVVNITRPEKASANFAFVWFESSQSIDRVFLAEHVIDGVEVHIRRTRDFDDSDSKFKNSGTTTTILVSADVSIMKKITANDLDYHFSQFGKIFAVRKPTIKMEAAHFSFVQFATAESVDKVMEVKKHIVKGFQVNVSKSRTS